MPRLALQLLLFLLTLLSTTAAGTEWQHGRSWFYADPPFTFEQFLKGLRFSLPFLGFLTIHEFGHYFTARRHRLRVTLPYYIPLWLGFATTIGTMGAFIRLRSRVRSSLQFFDVGIAGPLAGFVAALGLLYYGFTHLPPPEAIFEVHPEWKHLGAGYARYVYTPRHLDGSGMVALGDNLLFSFFRKFVATGTVPNAFEVIYNPYLFAGYLALFFTALNLMPIGQLDGGHILYGLVGSRLHSLISPVLFVIFLFYTGVGMYRLGEATVSDGNWQDLLMEFGYVLLYVTALKWCLSRVVFNELWAVGLAGLIFFGQLAVSYFFPHAEGYAGFFPFALLLGRFLGVYHPPALYEHRLGAGRQLLGWFSLLIFILCFSPKPFNVY